MDIPNAGADRRRAMGTGLLMLAAAVAWLHAGAVEALAGPKITLTPMVTVAGKYDSNFYGVEKGEQGVYTLLVQPGFKAGLAMPKTNVEFAYTLEGYMYQSSSDVPDGETKANDLDYLGHLLSLGLTHQPTRRLTLGLDEGFYLTRYPYYYDRLATTIDQRKYWINRLSPSVFYDFENRFSAGFRYTWNKIVYDKDDADLGPVTDYYGDSNEQIFTLTLGYNPTRTTTLDLDYSHSRLKYDDEELANDYRSNSIMLAGQKRYKYFAFDAGVGWTAREYEAPDVDKDGDITFKFGITGQSPPPSERRRYLGKLFLRPMDHFYLGYVRNASTYGDYYIADRLMLSLGSLFWDRVNTQVRGWYQISSYEDFKGQTPSGNLETRKDKTLDISGTAGYLFTDVLALNLTVGRQDRNSNLAGYSYVNNYIILSLDFNFDVGARAGFVRDALYYW